MVDNKYSPYTGTLRHAPPLSQLSHNEKKRLALLEKELAAVLEKSSCKKSRIRFYVDGNLKGGSPFIVPDTSTFSRSLQRSLKESSIESTSATVQVLTRLASWLIFPNVPEDNAMLYGPAKRVMLMFPDGQGGSAIDDDDDDDDGTDASHSDDDDEDSVSTVGTQLPLASAIEQNDEQSPLTVSSLAEAYYAHHASAASENCLDQSFSSSSYSDHDASPQRLDYVITQVDIARMARNASRHLDVESILNLPTITYKSDSYRSPDQSASEHEGGEEAGWSWTIVPPANEDATKQEDEDCSKKMCVICLEQFKDGDRLRVLPCDHSFHVGCIDRWLSGSNSFEECYTSGCPTCKKPPTQCMEASIDGSVPSWAFARIGHALAKQNSV